MIDFSAIERQFRETLGFIQQDLARLLTLNPGVNYAAAAVIACACETLAKYRYGTREGARAFAKLLPPGPYQQAAKTLYNALRNGLVHGYDAQDVQVNGGRIGLGIAWRETPHLSVMQRDGRPCLVLNVHVLCSQLLAQIDDFRRELEARAEARDLFLNQWKRDRVERVGSEVEREAWQTLLSSTSPG